MKTKSSIFKGCTEYEVLTIQLNTNRIQIAALNFEAMSLSFNMVNVYMVILDIHSRSASSVH